MNTNRHKLVRMFLLGLVLGPTAHTFAQSDTLSGASYDIVDRFGVNMASGQVQLSQTPISIGGSMGLSHTITSLTSDFVNMSYGGGHPDLAVYGFGDELRGGLYSVVIYECGHIGGRCFDTQEPINDKYYGLRVFGPGAQEDFRMGSSGDWLPHKRPSASSLAHWQAHPVYGGFTGYVMTTGNGTRYYYAGEAVEIRNSFGDMGLVRRGLTKVVYPNGFTIEMASDGTSTGSIYSVRTNTGFQLKYDYTDAWAYNGAPTKVTALNNRYERCPHSSATCTPTDSWRYATYTWPGNEPDPWNLNSLKQPMVFRVRDAAGRITDYHHESYESEVGEHAPRIVRVEKDGDVVTNYGYGYPPHTMAISNGLAIIIQTQGIASINTATEPGGGSQGYFIGAPRYYAHPSNLIGYENVAGTGASKVNRVNTTKYGAMEKIDSWSQTVEFHYDWVDDPVENLMYIENYPTSVIQKAGDVEIGYAYDDRGNVTERAIIGEGVWVTAKYPSTCHGGNYRYCNKPEWIEDARGNRTHYEYHSSSGQISRKVAPDDANYRNPTTEYEYDQYYAHYKIDSDTIEQAQTPVWLLTKETHCQNSSMSSNRTCANGDDVVTEYEYDHYNLFLIGVAVTAKNSQGVLETRRTCYEYDVYGNKIGETNPRSNKATCQ